MKLRSLCAILPPLALVASLAAAQSPALVPVGGEIRVNTTTAASQFNSDVAIDDTGNFVIVWESGSFFGNREVFAQRFDASGTPQGSEFQVNTFTSGEQSGPRVAMDANGNFVVTWYSRNQFPPAIFSIVGRRYDSAGNPLGGELEISTGLTATFQDVAMAADGSFMVIWPGRPAGTSGANRIYARIYDNAGTPGTSPFVIYQSGRPGTDFPSVTAVPGGGWVASWTGDYNFATDNSDILAQRFDGNGSPVGPQVVVPSSASSPRQEPIVAASSDRIVVSWMDTAGDGSPRARLFDGGLTPLAGELQPSTLPLQPTQDSAVAIDGAGRFVVAWTEKELEDGGSPTRDGSESSILARVFDAGGNPLGGDFVVNTTTEGFQALPRLAMSPAGRLVATWGGPGADFSDDVFAQVYAPYVTPEEQIDAVIEEIEALITQGMLEPNKANPLITKLESIAAKLDAGKVGAACNQLGAFVNQVNAYISNGTLAPAQGQELIDATGSIRTNIGCS